MEGHQRTVGLELSTHIHEPVALAMGACRSGARVPHHTLHRCWIVKMIRHTHVHLQHRIHHVHAQPTNPAHALHPAHSAHAIHSYVLVDKGESVGVGHRKWVLLLLVVLIVQLAGWLYGARQAGGLWRHAALNLVLLHGLQLRGKT